MGRALLMALLLSMWARSLLQSNLGVLDFLQNIVTVLLIFKVAIELDELAWWINFTKISLIRQIRKGRFK